MLLSFLLVFNRARQFYFTTQYDARTNQFEVLTELLKREQEIDI